MENAVSLKISLFAAALVSALILCGASPARAQSGGWRDPESILLSDPKARAKAISQLKLGPGIWLVAAVTMTPASDSARTVEAIRDDPRAVIIVEAPRDVVMKWRARRGIRARTLSVAPALSGDLGIFYLPTVIRIENGRITGARR